MHRRALFLLAAAAIARADRRDDPNWEANLKRFIAEFNIFIAKVNADGVVDLKQWSRVEKAWAQLEGLS